MGAVCYNENSTLAIKLVYLPALIKALMEHILRTASRHLSRNAARCLNAWPAATAAAAGTACGLAYTVPDEGPVWWFMLAGVLLSCRPLTALAGCLAFFLTFTRFVALDAHAFFGGDGWSVLRGPLTVLALSLALSAAWAGSAWVGSAVMRRGPALAGVPRWIRTLGLRGVVAVGAVALVSVPPLGLFNVANPLTAAGALFPGQGWAGLGLSMALLALISCHREVLRWVGCFGLKPLELTPHALMTRRVIFMGRSRSTRLPLSLFAGCLAIGSCMTLMGAVGEMVALASPRAAEGHIAGLAMDMGRVDEGAESSRRAALAVADQVQRQVQGSGSIVALPENALGVLNAGTGALVHRLTQAPQGSDKLLALGAMVDGKQAGFGAPSLRFEGEGAKALQAASQEVAQAHAMGSVVLLHREGEPDGLVHIGLTRVPVPFAFRDSDATAVSAGFSGPASADLGGHRVGHLVCYEALLAPLAMESAAQSTHGMVVLANNWWTGSQNSNVIAAQVQTAWLAARLFGKNLFFASNTAHPQAADRLRGLLAEMERIRQGRP